MVSVAIKPAVAILLVLGLLGSPLGCLLMPCQMVADDCCRPAHHPAFTECPLDILSLAKAAPIQHSTPLVVEPDTSAPVAPAAAIFADRVHPVRSDGRDLQLRNRVLRI